MAHSLASLKKLGKSDLTRLVRDYQNKFDTVLNNINSELLDFKNKSTKFESDLEISKNVNKMVDQVTRLERKCWENEQYSSRECIEISGIPQSIKQIDLEKTVSNGSLRIKLGDDTVKSVTHKDDLKVFFPVNSILIDRE